MREVYIDGIDAPWAWFPRAAFAIAGGGDGLSELQGGWAHTGEFDHGAQPARVLGLDARLDDTASPEYHALAMTARRVFAAISLPAKEGAP